MKQPKCTRLFPILLSTILLGACTTIPVDEREQIREEVNQAAEETIAQMVADDPGLQTALDESAGYAVAQISTTKIPIVGGGYGLALLHDNENNTDSYLNISRIDVGPGIAAGRARVLVIIETREAFEKFREGTWERIVAAESAIGKSSSGHFSSVGNGFTLHYRSEAGVSLAATARVVKTSINHDLTDTGISEVSIPNTGFTSAEEQGETAPRVWDHKLPFMAQKVVDKGYDLPLPYSIGVTYANVDQEQILTGLQVGVNGGDIIPFEFVSFENATSQSNSVSVKADAWLFPFMNVFAMIGSVDGKAPMDVVLDGNGMLDHLGISCGGILPNPLCSILEDKTITLPIEAQYEGTTYGVGMTLAGGWNNWFVTVPMNYTYADMKGQNTDGASLTVTPRFGKVFNLGRKGNLALFVGGNYLDVDLTVDGYVETPDGGLQLDYIIDQENKDNWNAVVGFNWDINRRLSWSAEYDGFTGSRDAFITSLNWRY